MYSILINGREIGITESLTYIRQQSNGTFALCDESIAQGIAFAGAPYQLAGRPAMATMLPTVSVCAIDGGARLNGQRVITDQLCSNMDYLSMMVDVELPDFTAEEGENDAQPEV